MKALTAKQQELWDLKTEGKTSAEAAAILGLSPDYVRRAVTIIRKKLGITNAFEKACEAQLTESKYPEQTAVLIDAVTDPFVKVSEAMEACGLPAAAGAAVLRRLRTRFLDAKVEVHNLKTNEILDLLGKRIHLGLTYMDDKAMAEASFRDLALGVTAMVEKRQLLRGEPTQIVSDLERKKLNELLPALIAEGQRRGLVLDGQVIEKVVSPA